MWDHADAILRQWRLHHMCGGLWRSLGLQVLQPDRWNDPVWWRGILVRMCPLFNECQLWVGPGVCEHRHDGDFDRIVSSVVRPHVSRRLLGLTAM